MKRVLCLFLSLFLAVSCFSLAFAHGGRTDSKGGHKDNKNASGLGSYHYHCGGHPPHLHDVGVCPYGSGAKSASTPRPAATAKVTTAPKQAAASTLSQASSILTTPDMEADDTLPGITNNRGINIRESASVRSAKVGALPNTGTPVRIVETVTTDSGEIWYVIRLEDGSYGYVHGSFIDLIGLDDAA